MVLLCWILTTTVLISFVTGAFLIYLDNRQNEKMGNLIEDNCVGRFFDNNSFLSSIKYQDSNLHNTIELCEVLEEAREIESKMNYSKLDDEVL